MRTQVEAFLQFLADERRLSANTLSAYRNDLRQFEEYLSSDGAQRLDRSGTNLSSGSALAGAQRADVIEFFLTLREKGYAAATIARKMAAIKSVYQFLHSR